MPLQRSLKVGAIIEAFQGVPLLLVCNSVCHLFGLIGTNVTVAEKQRAIKKELSLSQTVAIFLPIFVSCWCFRRRLSPVYKAMSLVASTPWKASS